jgi:hypothetical protein
VNRLGNGTGEGNEAVVQESEPLAADRGARTAISRKIGEGGA